MQERVYPILTHRYEFIPDSAVPVRTAAASGSRATSSSPTAMRRCRSWGSRAVEPVWGYDGGEAAMGSGLVHGDEESG